MSELNINSGGPAFDEDPVLRRPSKPAWTEVEFVEFFKERELPGSPTEGYLVVAQALVSDLNTMQMHMAAVSEETEDDMPAGPLELALVQKPFDGHRVSRNDATKLYLHEENPATQAFRGRLEFMLKAKLRSVATARGGGTLSYYTTRYQDPVNYRTMNPYLIEHRGRDESGEFTQLWLKSLLGADILARFGNPFKAALDREFYTTAQTEEQVLNFYGSTLGVIPTAQVDEAELIRRYFGRAA